MIQEQNLAIRGAYNYPEPVSKAVFAHEAMNVKAVLY